MFRQHLIYIFGSPTQNQFVKKLVSQAFVNETVFVKFLDVVDVISFFDGIYRNKCYMTNPRNNSFNAKFRWLCYFETN